MFRRRMAFAGSWYPADAKRCEARLRSWWERPVARPGSRLGVVPHAGWVFSGAVTAGVVQALPHHAGVELVVVLGGHLGSGDPVVAMTEGSWETPFGALAIHRDFRPQLETLPAVIFEDERRHYEDNTIELQLPFLKWKYPDAELLPIRVPAGTAALELGALLADHLTGVRGAVVLASTDLTHYGPAYRFEPQGRGLQALAWVREQNDRAFLEAMATLDGQRILNVAREHQNACSPGAVAALAVVARREAASYRTLEYTTSQDVKPGDPLNFVGYVGGLYGETVQGWQPRQAP